MLVRLPMTESNVSGPFKIPKRYHEVFTDPENFRFDRVNNVVVRDEIEVRDGVHSINLTIGNYGNCLKPEVVIRQKPCQVYCRDLGIQRTDTVTMRIEPGHRYFTLSVLDANGVEQAIPQRGQIRRGPPPLAPPLLRLPPSAGSPRAPAQRQRSSFLQRVNPAVLWFFKPRVARIRQARMLATRAAKAAAADARAAKAASTKAAAKAAKAAANAANAAAKAVKAAEKAAAAEARAEKAAAARAARALRDAAKAAAGTSAAAAAHPTSSSSG